MKLHFMTQRSPEWGQERLGKMGGSKIKNIVDAKMKIKAIGPLRTAASKMIAEQQTLQSCDSEYQNDSMEHGNEYEPHVIEKYTDENHLYVGLVTNETYPSFEVSPDMIFAKFGVPFKGCEIKCPNSDTHVKWMIENKVPTEHMPQCIKYFVMMPSLESLRFISYDPRNDINPYFVKTINRDDVTDLIDNMKTSMLAFEKTVANFITMIEVAQVAQ